MRGEVHESIESSKHKNDPICIQFCVWYIYSWCHTLFAPACLRIEIIESLLIFAYQPSHPTLRGFLSNFLADFLPTSMEPFVLAVTPKRSEKRFRNDNEDVAFFTKVSLIKIFQKYVLYVHNIKHLNMNFFTQVHGHLSLFE